MFPLTAPSVFRLLAFFAWGSLAFAQDKPAPRIAELLSYGGPLPDIQITVGNKEVKASLAVLPPGVSVPLGAEKTLTLSRVEVVDGKSHVVPLATVSLPGEMVAPLVLVVPPAHQADPAVPYEVRVIDQDLPLRPGVLNIYNLTPATMMIQSSDAETPVAVSAWGKGTFKPKVDAKFRAHVRVAYTNADGRWTIVKDSATAFRPDFFCRMRIVLAAQGMGALADVLSKERSSALVYIDEQQVRLLDPKNTPSPEAAPVYKPPYEHVEVTLAPTTR